MKRILGSLLMVVVAVLMAPQEKPPGYDDTPQLPGQKWRVHDRNRPRPKVIRPAEPGKAPSDAVVLFDGSSLDAWSDGQGKPTRWTIDGGAMLVGKGNIRTRETFGDCQLHVEWMAPTGSQKASQGRSNSGVFLMGRYEVQVLDSFQNVTYADGQAAALYGQYPPAVNACRAPGRWQTYDIIFRAPRFEGERCVSPARVTVLHNGVAVHVDRAFIGPTRHKTVPVYKPHAPAGPIVLQDHGDPIRFRNIWVRRL